MAKNERLDLFHDECRDSLRNLKGLKEVAAHLYYYDNSYAKPIREYFEKRGIESKELEFKNGSPFIPMCSLTSSARLCLLYFYNLPNRDDYLYEQLYPIVKENGKKLTDAHPDAIYGDYFYECKCQEVVDGEGERLRESYLTSAKYFKELFLDLSGITSMKGELHFGLNTLDIELDYKYDEAQINVKQLICHLLSLANRAEITNRRQYLQYIIFVPNNYEAMKDIYGPLANEIEKIFLTENQLIKFARNHNIAIEKPVFVRIGDLQDPFI